MGLYEKAKAKERLKITDTAEDTQLDNFGLECDDEIFNELYRQATRNGKAKALPYLDITNGLIGGVAVPQSLKDASTNRVVARWHAMHNNPDMAKFWQDLSDKAIAGYIAKLEVDATAWASIVDSDFNQTGQLTLSGMI